MPDKELEQKKIGFWSLTALVVGNLVGAGVFMLPAALAPFKGISFLGCIAASLGAILLAIVFAKLAAKLPYTGGPYVYVREAFGEKLGFLTCWGYWLMAWISNSALVISIVGYLLPLLPQEYAIYSLHIQIFILVALSAFNLFGVNVTAKGELFITIFKVIPLLLLPLIGLFWVNVDHFEMQPITQEGFWTSLNTVAFLTLWGFIGLETGTVPGGQVDKPIKTIPRAIITGTSITMCIYILGAIVTMGVLSCDVLSQSRAPYADIASYIFGGNWGAAVSIIAVISILGTLHGWILIVGQIPLGAVKDGLFPQVFGKTNRFGSPYISILISCCCTIPLVIFSHHESLVKQFQFIIEVSVTLIFIIYLACVLSYWRLVHRMRRLRISEKVLILFSLLFIFWAMSAASVSMFVLSGVSFLLGIPVYFWVKNEVKKAKIA